MKKLLKVLFSILLFFVFQISVKADYLSVSASAKTVTVGNKVKITVYLNSYEAGLNISSSNSKVLAGGVSADWVDKSSYTTYFEAKSKGTSVITVSTKNGTTMDPGNEKDLNLTRKVTITVVDKSSSGSTTKPSVDVNKKLSSNNYLKSLSIDGFMLEPEFKKDVIEYNVTLPVDTTKVKILAETEDEKASIKGIGEVNVVEGSNTLLVTAVAENGNEKQYKINATVLEPNPIVVSVNNTEYTVVRKKGLVENIPTGFIDKVIYIEDQAINAYYNSDARITLVGLKDKDGNIKLFRYEEDKYYSFNEVKTAGLNLLILDDETDIPLGYTKNSLTINGNKIVAYKYENLSVYLVYAIDLETGEKKLYNYDKYSNTFQVYTSTLSDYLNERIKIREYIIMGLMGFSFVLLLIAIFKKGKVKKDTKEELTGIEKVFFEEEKPKKTIYEENDISIEDVKIKEELEVKKIEDTDYKIPKRSKKQRQKEINDAKKKLNEAKRSFKRVSLDDDE